MQPITEAHRKRIEEIRKKLNDIGCRESAFTSIELLFYEALSISRTYGNDTSNNTFLSALQQVEQEQYRETRNHYPKSKQREQAIRRFIIRLRSSLVVS
jgi:hypothetical protein